ncbi:hypothetical protein BDV93DRAFT_130007 [Ceratobasidium sp. AG-I]|nr:hypothetical protein BDV93DRAFT_130007 [Ceratobasidium sp. AG-I]
MSFSAFRLGSDPPKDEPSPKFIVATPGERPAPKLFVSNDPDDGYNLTFPCLADFETWRQQEEDTHTIEFIKGDTHGSRTNPPRFKEHVKLVCARHTRRGRKQYVKKHPERTRKTPSRKIDGVGCPASICYKTYVDTDVVRAMYNQEHSHPTGLANLPFTRKGQRSLARSKSIQQPSPTSVTSTSEDESQSSNAQSPCVPVPRIPVFRPRSLEGSEQLIPNPTLDLNPIQALVRSRSRAIRRFLIIVKVVHSWNINRRSSRSRQSGPSSRPRTRR